LYQVLPGDSGQLINRARDTPEAFKECIELFAALVFALTATANPVAIAWFP